MILFVIYRTVKGLCSSLAVLNRLFYDGAFVQSSLGTEY